MNQEQQDQLDPELQELLKKTKLKEPPEKLMADYLSGVNEKIDRGIGKPHFGFPPLALVLVAGVLLAGIFYYFLAEPEKEPVMQAVAPAVVAPIEVPSQPPPSVPAEANLTDTAGQPQPASESLSIEEQIAILESFAEEFPDETGELFGEEELLNEFEALDEMELSALGPTQTAG